jgi:outer membrane protein TolC
LALDQKKINYQDKINYVYEEFDDYNDISGDHEDFNDDTRDNTVSQLEQQKDFDEDKIIQQTTTAYNGIVTMEKELDKTEKQLEIKSKEISDTKLKNSLGLITTIDLKTIEIQIESLQNEQKSNQNALKDAQDSFEVLTGKDVTKYILEQDIEYDTFKIDGSVDEYLDNIIDSYLNYKTQLYELNKDYYKDDDNYVSYSSTSSVEFEIDDLTTDSIDDYKDDVTTAKSNIADDTDIDTDFEKYYDYLDTTTTYTEAVATYTAALATRLVYLNAKLGVYESQTSLSETKKAFREQLRTLYTNLLTLEDNINTLKKNIELSNKQLSNSKLKYDLGIITKTEYDNQALVSAGLDIQLRGLIDNYNTIKQDIKKPWIAF